MRIAITLSILVAMAGPPSLVTAQSTARQGGRQATSAAANTSVGPRPAASEVASVVVTRAPTAVELRAVMGMRGRRPAALVELEGVSIIVQASGEPRTVGFKDGKATEVRARQIELDPPSVVLEVTGVSPLAKPLIHLSLP